MSGALKLPGGSEAQTRDGDLLWSAFRKVAGALGLTLAGGPSRRFPGHGGRGEDLPRRRP